MVPPCIPYKNPYNFYSSSSPHLIYIYRSSMSFLSSSSSGRAQAGPSITESISSRDHLSSAATLGWIAPRPIASSGKLNITHVYPTQRQRIQNLKTFLHNHWLSVMTLEGLTCSRSRLDWIFHPSSHYSRLNYPAPPPCAWTKNIIPLAPPGFAWVWRINRRSRQRQESMWVKLDAVHKSQKSSLKFSLTSWLLRKFPAH